MKDEANNRVRAQGTRGFTVSGFPFKQWLEWEKGCKESFGDCYWLKIWSDHVVAGDTSSKQALFDKIALLEERLLVLEQVSVSKLQEEKKAEAITFSGKFGGG